MKKNFLIAMIFFIYRGIDSGSLSFTTGPGWLKLHERDSLVPKSDKSITKKTTYTLNTGTGFIFFVDLRKEWRTWLEPEITYAFYQFKKGCGAERIEYVRNKESLSTTYHLFTPNCTFKELILGDNITLWGQRAPIPMKLSLFLGYNYSTFFFLSDIGDDVGISSSVYKGFVGGLKYAVQTSEAFSLFIADYVYPDTIKTHSFYKSFGPGDATFLRYLLFCNIFNVGFSYTIAEKFHFLTSATVEVYKSMGRTQVCLADTVAKVYTDYHYGGLSAFVYTLSMGFSYVF